MILVKFHNAVLAPDKFKITEVSIFDRVLVLSIILCELFLYFFLCISL